MIKKYLFAFLLFLFGSSTYAAQLFIQPNFADPRFEPSDKLHAGCVNQATVNLKTNSKETISSFRFVVSYEPQNMEILEIKANPEFKDILDSKIEYDKIIISLLNKELPKSETTQLFTIIFKSNEFATKSMLAIRKPSYVIDQENKEIPIFVEEELEFTKVPECEPDTIPPTISIIKPEDTKQPIGLDTYFSFLIEDLGKGIDKSSVIIDFNGKLYTGFGESIIWDDKQLFFYPQERLPVGKNISLNISINDKQIYGGPNKISKSFSFKTHNQILFENNLTPNQYRTIANKAKKIYATDEECAALKTLSNNLSTINFPIDSIESLSKKINCSFDKNTIINNIEKDKDTKKSVVFLSVFSVLGWVLFAISFILKLHYLVSYKKHKKISKSLQSSQPNQ